MQALGLLFVLGLASAITPEVKKVTVFGIQEGLPLVQGIVGMPQLETLGSQFFGLRTGLPLGLQFGVPFVNQYMNLPSLGLRNDLLVRNQYDIHRKPIILGVKTQPGVEELNVVLLEHGLSTLGENPTTKFIDEFIKTGVEKSAIIINPTTVLDTPVYDLIKDLPIVKLDIPVGLKLGGLVNNIVSQIPIVLILEKEEVKTLNVQGLVRLQNLDINV